MDSKYAALNSKQAEAVKCTEGPLLILAGAGSGKTRVLTHRAAYLIEEKGIEPWHIMAITFTNKAADEMRERIDSLAASGANEVWVSTFHSACVRILRRHIDRLGYTGNFSIYDTEDQKTVIKQVCRRLNIDTKLYKEKMFMAAISNAKDELISPEEYERRNYKGDYSLRLKARVYLEYQSELKKNNALDFDDLIVKTVELFKENNDVLSMYQDRFRYIMVDEYQDTNTAQFHLVRLLAEKYKNLCVVGDDDQSIYKFRGANIKNILNFETYFPGAKVVKLEENYRSTSNILDAANAVIKNNTGRKEKKLWTMRPSGDAVDLAVLDNAYEEASYIALKIKSNLRRGIASYGDNAILYRTNAQSRILEEEFVKENIPYIIVGGVNFYSRKEIKDILAYLKTIDNAKDDLSVKRIINVPRRGIGQTTISRIEDYAADNEMSFYEALVNADNIPGLSRAVSKIKPFTNFITVLRSALPHISLEKLMDELLEATGYVDELEAENTEEARARIENIDEFISKVAAYEESADEPTLSGFLEEVSLIADIDNLNEDEDHVVFMTFHGAKGLEFPYVYMSGMEDGLFPGFMTIAGGDSEELEEERRLCYVGITRAKEHLTLTASKMRMIRGETHYNRLSRFVREIPGKLINDVTGALPSDSYKRSYDKGSSYQMPGSGGYFGAGTAAKADASVVGGSSFSKKAPSNPYAQYSAGRKSISGEGLSYDVGDRVRHMKFGEGSVTNIAPGGRDYEVTVNFDKYGVKKMFASFAKLKKI